MRATLLAAAAALVLVPTAPAAAQFTVRPVALSGQQVFGSPGEQFISFRQPLISQQGHVGFVAGASVRGGMFLWRDGVGQAIARQHDPIVGSTGLFYHTMGSPRIDDQGRAAAWVTFSAGTGSGAIVAGLPGALTLQAVERFVEPPATGYISGAGVLRDPYLSRDGQLAFAGGHQNERRIYAGTPGSLARVLNTADPLPAAGPDVVIGQVDLTAVLEGGGVLARGQLYGGGHNAVPVPLRVGPGGIEALVLPGQPAPGTGGGTFTQASAVGNGLGAVAVTGSYLDPGGETRGGLWAGHAGGLSLLARPGDPAPGFAPGWSLAFAYGPMINRAGGVTTLAYAQDGMGGQRQGVWVSGPEGLELLARAGDPVANAGEGATVLSFTDVLGGGTPSFTYNALGRVAFTARTGTSVQDHAMSLVVSDPDLGLVALATVGRPFEVERGDSRTVSLISVLTSGASPFGGISSDSGFGTFLNDRDEVVFGLEFSDGSRGVFLVVVPGPGAASLGLSMGLFAARRRRR